MRALKTFAVGLLVGALAAPAVAAPWEKAQGVDWTKPPPIGAEPKWAPPKPKRLKLKNGIQVLVIENHKLPLFAMELIVPGAGAASDPAGKGGLAAFAADMLDEGAGGLGALELSDQIDRLGASITPYTAVDYAGVSVSGLTKTMDPTLDLFVKVVTAPTFDAKEGERVHGDRLTNLKLRPDRPREVAAHLLNIVLFGHDSAYGHAPSGDPEPFDKLTVADAQAFYQSAWGPKGMTLVVAGDVDPVALKAKLDAGLGAWKNPKAKPAKAPKVKPEKLASRLYVVDRPGAEQSDVRIGVVGIKRSDKRYYAVEVLATILGGTFTSRLNHRLREELAYTYGIRAAQLYQKDVAPFLISSGIFTPNTVDGLKEILAIVGDLEKNEVPAEELDKAKLNMMRQLPQQFQTDVGIAQAYADLVIHGLPDDWYAGYAAKVSKITAKDVKAAAKALIPSNKLIFVVVGDMSELKTGLEGLGLGTTVEYGLDEQLKK